MKKAPLRRDRSELSPRASSPQASSPLRKAVEGEGRGPPSHLSCVVTARPEWVAAIKLVLHFIAKKYFHVHLYTMNGGNVAKQKSGHWGQPGAQIPTPLFPGPGMEALPAPLPASAACISRVSSEMRSWVPSRLPPWSAGPRLSPLP